MAMERLPGRLYDEEDDDVGDVATAWGASLARLHLAGQNADLEGLPELPSLLPQPDAFIGLGSARAGRLADAVRDTARELAAIPRDTATHGVLHGDPEIDNVVFTPEGPVFIDLDDVRQGWFAADVAFALRSWTGATPGPEPQASIPASFVDGYRSVRDLTDAELSWIPVLSRASNLEKLARLVPLVALSPQPTWPGWAVSLHARLVAMTDDLIGSLCPRARC